MRTISTDRPKATKQAKPTEDYIKAVNDILETGFSQIQMVGDLYEALHIPDSSDLRLVSIRLLTEQYWETLNGDVRGTAIEGAQQALEDFAENNPYHAEYSLVAYYEDPNSTDRDCEYGGLTSDTLLPQTKLKAQVKHWFQQLPPAKPNLANPNSSLPRSWARCKTTVVDSRGNSIITQPGTLDIR